MGGLVEGAALGAAFELFFKSVVDATHKVARFSSDLKRLKSTLCSIAPVLHDIDDLDRILNRPHHEITTLIDLLLEGEKLIRKCSKVKWNIFKKLYYSMQLSKLESHLVNFFQINVAALHFPESKRISVAVTNLEEKINELTSMIKASQICGCNSENDFSKTTVGFEQYFIPRKDRDAA